MLAAFLSLLVIAGCVKSYVALNRIMLIQQQLQSEQFKALTVINLINAEIAKAGQRGCYPIDNDAIKINNDVLTIRYQDYGVNIQADSDRHHIVIDKILTYHKGQQLMISDCEHAEIFNIAALHVKYGKQVITPVQPLKYGYHDYAEVGTDVIHQYFIANKRLLRADWQGRLQTIATGINHLIFQDDGKGVRFQFDTEHQGKLTTWYGYAIKSSS